MSCYRVCLLPLLLSLSAPLARAQGLPTAGERNAANAVSWASVGANIALDTWDAAHDPRPGRALALEGVRLGTVWAVASIIKAAVHEARPCAPNDCGIDDPNKSMPSLHTAFSFSTVNGRKRLAVHLTLAAATAGGRVGARKHWWKDVGVGVAGVGASFIR